MAANCLIIGNVSQGESDAVVNKEWIDVEGDQNFDDEKQLNSKHLNNNQNQASSRSKNESYLDSILIDMKKMGEYLESKEIRIEKVLVNFQQQDKQISNEEIRNEIKQLFEDIQKQGDNKKQKKNEAQMYLIYYSGCCQKQTGKWIFGKENKSNESSIGLKEVIEIWKNSKAYAKRANLGIIIDSSYSGKINKHTLHKSIQSIYYQNKEKQSNLIKSLIKTIQAIYYQNNQLNQIYLINLIQFIIKSLINPINLFNQNKNKRNKKKSK